MSINFNRWTPNIQVAIYERGNAEIVRAADCPCEKPPQANKRGDCGNCKNFMGAKIPDGRTVYLGDVFPASCWQKVVLPDAEPSKVASP